MKDLSRLLVRVLALLVIATLNITAFAQGPEVGGHGPSQLAADAIRAHAQSDGGFLAAGLIKASYDSERLETLLLYPTEELVVVSLTGAQIRLAFERSLSLIPQPNSSFLQISGFEVTYRAAADPNARVVSVNAGGTPLQDDRLYSIAMPASLGRGGLGYFKIWDRTRIVRTFTGVTVESILTGRRATDIPSRWIAR